MGELTIGLVGNPNCGKTTLFNALTGHTQKVGNWPGVTVSRKTGSFIEKNRTIDVVDLPGTYSLSSCDDDTALDRCIACDYIKSKKADVIVNIIDGNNLERNLYLTAQLLEMQVPTIIVINMVDIAKRRGVEIDVNALQKLMGCPVVEVIANRNIGIDVLKQAIINHNLVCPENHVEAYRQEAQTCNEDEEIAAADARYRFASKVTQKVTRQLKNIKANITEKIDRVVLSRVWGIPIFLLVMYAMFFFAINIGGAFQDFFDISSDTIFVSGTAYLLHGMHAPSWLIALLSGGFGRGINTVVTFIPVIGGMFLFLSFLEASGYMARAAFVMDRLMRALGLPGKSFVPMIVGFGCNVPAIMAARTLDSRRDRILTVMMSPFMSCGARLAIYAVFVAAFFKHGGQNIIFSLYFIGILMAMLTGFLLRKTLLKGKPAPFVMELPAYHIPRFGRILKNTWQRLKGFLFRAGRLILPVCTLIGVINLAWVGHILTPIFAPMGIHANNWPAIVGLITGVLAKEVVVATLNTLYSQVGHLSAQHAAVFHLWSGLKTALYSVPQNLKALPQAFINPVLSSAAPHDVNRGVLGVMYQYFVSPAAAYAYLLFVLLYFPCVSATAAMTREISRAWTGFSVLWTTGLAYAVATVFYQLATFPYHQRSSVDWIVGVLLVLTTFIMSLKFYIRRMPSRPQEHTQEYAEALGKIDLCASSCKKCEKC